MISINPTKQYYIYISNKTSSYINIIRNIEKLLDMELIC